YQGAKKKDGTAVCTKVTYQGRKGPDGQPIDVYVDVDNYGYFYLNAGEVAVFKMSDDGIKYNVKEVDVDQYHLEKITINGEETDHVDVNDDPTVVTNNVAEAGEAAVRDRSSVLYTNYPKTQALKITKHIIGDIEEDTNPVFEFHVYLETTEKDDQGNEKHILIPYSHGPYYLVKAAEPGEVLHYYQLTGKDAEHGWTNMPVDMGTDPVVCSETGSSGSISRIPPEYTIIIPDILDGTHFYLTERLDNLPEGYSFVREELKDGTYDPCTLDPIEVRHQLASDETEVSDTYDPETIGKIKDGVDAESHIYNRHGIVATKKWQDAYGNDLDSRNNPLWEANVTFKLRKKTVTETDDGEEVTYSDVYSDPTDKPQYYKDHHLNWSDTQTVTSVTGEAKWENLDRLGENESYVIIEQAIEGVAEEDIVRDEKSGAIKSFKLNGKVFNTIDGVLPEEGGTTINKEQPLTDIEVQKIWSTPEGMDPGTATMVLYQAVGNKDLEEGEIDPAKPSRKIRVTIDASLISETTGETAGTTKSAYIDIAYTGTDSGTYRLNNQNGWKHTFEFDRGGVYNFTYTPDGNKVKTVDPTESADISTSMTIPLVAEVADMTQHTYTFAVPASERPEKGSITVTCNGTEKIAGPTNNWTVDFTVADEEAVTYSAEADGKFITDVTLDPEAASGETATANKNVSMHPTAAPLTLTVPVTVNWDKEPPEGTEVTVTLTPDKSGVEPKTVTLTASDATSGTEWKAADQTLDRLDNNGDLITWTVTTAATSAANNVSVALSSPAGAKISDTASDVVVDGSVAPTTMTVPISVNWGTETPDAGTKVTVTFTSGSSTETVELDGTVDGTETSAWHADKELPRLDANGNLLTWTVSTSVGPEGTSASVSGAPASVSDPDGDSQAGPVELTGTVARGMNLTIKVPSNTFANFGEFFLVDSNKVRSSENLSGFETGYKGNGSDYSKTYSGLEVKDSSGNDIYYAIKLWNPPYKVTTNANEAGTDTDRGNKFLWIKAQSGDVTIQLENISQTQGNPDWQIITGQSMNSASGLRKAATRTMMKAPAKAASQGSPIQTFYDPAVNTSEEATGKVPFTKVEFKDLPEGATIVDVDGEDESGTQTVTGNSTFKWQNLPTMDADGNPIYYYIVEKDATAQADTMNVKYEYEYNDDGSISKVKITNTTTGTPTPQTGDITITKSFSGVDALPTGFKITNSYDDQVFTVQNATGTNPYTWTLSGIPDETVVTFTESGATVNGYDLTVTSSGTVIADSKVSATVIAGSTVTTGFVNTYEEKKTTVTLKKVDKSKVNKEPLEASDLLDGATFVLKKYEQLSPEKEDTTWNTAHATPNTGESGVFTFSDLTPGTYKIVETEYPSGYVKLSSDPIFRVVVDEETGDLEIELVDSADGMVRLVDGEMTIVVGNEPGQPLPNSGGPGTTLFYIFGSILLLGSVIVLAGRAISAKN
ncbi:MAG: Cna B-type domain-containing protein, partial [Clostridiales bacterium]|nr:Cna B-type domain-containing protein [Clostridiales bacterium]